MQDDSKAVQKEQGHGQADFSNSDVLRTKLRSRTYQDGVLGLPNPAPLCVNEGLFPIARSITSNGDAAAHRERVPWSGSLRGVAHARTRTLAQVIGDVAERMAVGLWTRWDTQRPTTSGALPKEPCACKRARKSPGRQDRASSHRTPGRNRTRSATGSSKRETEPGTTETEPQPKTNEAKTETQTNGTRRVHVNMKQTRDTTVYQFFCRTTNPAQPQTGQNPREAHRSEALELRTVAKNQKTQSGEGSNQQSERRSNRNSSCRTNRPTKRSLARPLARSNQTSIPRIAIPRTQRTRRTNRTKNERTGRTK